MVAARHGERAAGDDTRRPVTELEAENSRLKRELAEMKMERDLLKKATAYFARNPGEVRADENVEGTISGGTDESGV